MDGLTVDGNAELSSTNVRLDLFESDTTDLNTRFRHNGGSLLVRTTTDDGLTDTTRMSIDHATGDISFYEDTGTTAKFFWDASAESLGIGTSSPSVNLDIRDESTSGIAQIGIRGGASGAGVLRLSGGGTTYGASSFDLFQNGAGGYVWAQSSLPIVFGTNSTERMRIDSSGNLLVGDTTTTPYADSSGTGMAYRDDYGIFSVKSAGIQASIFNRTGSDGAITEFRKDGTTVGSIGTSSGNTFIGTGDTALLFDDANNRITPWNTNNADRDWETL